MNPSRWQLFTSCNPATYDRLIEQMIAERSMFSLTSLEGRFNEIWPMWSAIKRHVVEEKRTTQTPIGYKSLSLVRTFRACEGLRSFLNAPGGLFEWCHPTWPEDLCIYDSNIEPWLITVSHEHYFLCDLNLVPLGLGVDFEVGDGNGVGCC